ncbi:MAG: DUF1801 domain-containing protein [Anaerolineales bacterium]|nr:DUF1801 domain-containing protein [Anaerolineales bacterium]
MPARPNKTQVTTASVADFIAKVPDEQKRSDAAMIVALMEKATKQPGRMWGQAIIGFGEVHYVYASGREGDWFLMGLSPRKAALSLYALGGYAAHTELLAGLGKHTLGVGCLYIKQLADVKLPVLKQLIQAAAKAAKTQAMTVK